MPDDINQVEPNAELEQQLEAANNNYKRALADFENYKRRQAQEGAELVDFVRTDTFRRLLPMLDSLEQALKHSPDSSTEGFASKYENWMIGIKGILMQLDQSLLELGVQKIEAKGKKFDPHFHEAVKEAEGEEDGMVVDELQTGFTVNGKLIRPSQVTISKKFTEGENK